MLPLLAVALALAVVSVLLLVGLAERAVRRADAQTAADAAALSGLYEGETGAAELARRNGAELVSFRHDGTSVEVVVVIDTITARARATLDWDSAPLDSDVAQRPGVSR